MCIMIFSMTFDRIVCRDSSVKETTCVALYHVFSLSVPLVSLFFFSLTRTTTHPESILLSSRQPLISLESRANEECAQRERNLFTVPCLSSIRPEDNQTELRMTTTRTRRVSLLASLTSMPISSSVSLSSTEHPIDTRWSFSSTFIQHSLSSELFFHLSHFPFLCFLPSLSPSFVRERRFLVRGGGEEKRHSKCHFSYSLSRSSVF